MFFFFNNNHDFNLDFNQLDLYKTTLMQLLSPLQTLWNSRIVQTNQSFWSWMTQLEAAVSFSETTGFQTRSTLFLTDLFIPCWYKLGTTVVRYHNKSLIRHPVPNCLTPIQNMAQYVFHIHCQLFIFKIPPPLFCVFVFAIATLSCC